MSSEPIEKPCLEIPSINCPFNLDCENCFTKKAVNAEPINVGPTEIDFSCWITIYEDLFEKFLSMSDEDQVKMKEIVEEMFRRGFRHCEKEVN